MHVHCVGTPNPVVQITNNKIIRLNKYNGGTIRAMLLERAGDLIITGNSVTVIDATGGSQIMSPQNTVRGGVFSDNIISVINTIANTYSITCVWINASSSLVVSDNIIKINTKFGNANNVDALTAYGAGLSSVIGNTLRIDIDENGYPGGSYVGINNNSGYSDYASFCNNVVQHINSLSGNKGIVIGQFSDYNNVINNQLKVGIGTAIIDNGTNNTTTPNKIT